MKKIETKTGNLFIGTAREICSIYKNFREREIAMPIFSDFPKFNMGKIYGLSVETYDEYTENCIFPQMSVIAGDTALAMIYEL